MYLYLSWFVHTLNVHFCLWWFVHTLNVYFTYHDLSIHVLCTFVYHDLSIYLMSTFTWHDSFAIQNVFEKKYIIYHTRYSLFCNWSFEQYQPIKCWCECVLQGSHSEIPKPLHSNMYLKNNRTQSNVSCGMALLCACVLWQNGV